MHEGGVDQVVLLHVGHIGFQALREPLDRPEGLVGPGDRDQIVCRPAYDGTVELLLVAEVVVEQAPGDARFLREYVDRQLLERPGGQQPDTEVEQLLAASVRGHPGAATGGAHGGHPIELPSIPLLTYIQYSRRFLSWTPKPPRRDPCLRTPT